jgi:uncharacterized protein (TIGR02588 family)
MAEPRNDRPPVLEWIASAIGAAFVLAILGIIGWHGVTGRQSPPDLVAEVVATRQTSAGYDVDIRVANAGSVTAAEVGVEGTSADGETAETLFDFVPGESERFGTLVFGADPGAGGPSLRVTGYREP